jgi:3-oxoacyl-[acyl-carrier-protein] synthase-1
MTQMHGLATEAAQQALAPLETTSGLRVAALLALAAPRPGLGANEIRSLARDILQRLPVTLVRELSGVFDTGADGGIAAIERATQILATDSADLCLVGGVDTYREPDTLRWLAKDRRLKDEATPHGFIPGEGAAFILLSTREMTSRLRLATRGRLLGLHRALEPSPWYSGRSTTGRGLTAAIAGAFEGLPPDVRADMTYCDANGEPWRADEWAFAYLRTARRHADPLDLRHPADSFGHVGAATVPLLLTTAFIDIARGRARGPRALVWCASDTRPFRGAALLEGHLEEGFSWA